MPPISDYSYGTVDDSEPSEVDHQPRGDIDDPAGLLSNSGASSLTKAIFKRDETAFRVLPISLLASLGMAITSATTVFAYAKLTCADPARCRESESNSYAAAVAVAVCIANVCGTLTLGPLQRLVKRNQKAGLMIWLLFRSLGVAVLAIGVYSRKIGIAISGRLFEGLASDNILHFNLNGIYVQTPCESQISRLMGTSLALFMVGMSIGPYAGGLFADFVNSFFGALAIFALSTSYLAIFVHQVASTTTIEQTGRLNNDPTHLPQPQSMRSKLLGVLSVLFSPLQLFVDKPKTLMHGMALLSYNMAQSYLFPAVMIHCSLRYGFTGKENGLLISLAAGTSALYLATTLFAIPKLFPLLRRLWNFSSLYGKSRSRARESANHDLTFGIISIGIQAVAVFLIGLSQIEWQVYPLICLAALGLAAPSFMKSHFVPFLSDGPQAISSLAAMESVGAILSPVCLGAWQSAIPGGSVFFLAATILLLSLIFLVLGSFSLKRDLTNSSSYEAL